MKNFTLTISLFMLLFSSSSANEFLNLVHPEQWSWAEPGYIHSASILVEPGGLYARCELIIDFETGQAYHNVGENLEVEMEFNLPSGTQITDLHLWIEDEPVQAFIFDSWTATLIYESIVQRRIDPAILVKRGANNYNLKVYPITKYFPRRVKIEYITPVNYVDGVTQWVSLPVNILNLSQTEPDKFKVAFKGNGKYTSPAILENSSLKFEQENDVDFGLCELVNIDTLKDVASGTLAYEKTDSTAEFHLATYQPEKSDEKFFELAIDYNEFDDFDNYKKTVFMLDFVDANCSYYSKKEMLQMLKQAIKKSFSSKDSFNILVSGFSTKYLSENWISGNPIHIDSYFENLSASNISGFSNLPGLLLDGINFIQDNKNSGSLVLISSSNINGEHQQANSLIREVLDYMGSPRYPLHIVDLDNLHYNYNQRHYIAGQYFMGNEYLYSRLSSMTGGEHFSLRSETMVSMLESVTGNISNYLRSLEVFIQTDGGYTFSNYYPNQRGNFLYQAHALKMLGKYIGDPPFTISVYGQNSADEVFHFNKTIGAESITEGSSCISKAWSASYMQELMGMDQNNQVVGHIISTSIRERILSGYTAFLVLEPGFEIPDIKEIESIESPMVDVGGWPITDVIESGGADLQLSLSNYPNPFTTSTNISYTLPEHSSITLSVYSSSGQLVEILVDESQEIGEYNVQLDASAYEKGIYFCTLQINGAVMAKLKLVVV